MKKAHKILIGTAIIQIVFLLLSFWGKRDLGHYAGHEPLLSFSKNDISKIQLKTKENTLSIIKEGDNWVLPSYHTFPVKTSKITDLLTNLSNLKKGWPVGKTAVASKQLKTTQEDSDKQLHLFKGDNIIHTIYFGTSPSFKKVHMRVDANKEIYLLPFETYRLRTDELSWRDDSLLQQDKNKISKVTLGAVELINNDNVWKLPDLKETEEMVSEEVDRLLSAITNLRFDDILGTQNKKEYRQKEPTLEFSVTLNEKQENYKFSTPSKNDYYILKTSKYPFYFKIEKSKVDLLTKIERKTLVKHKQL